MKLPKEIIEKFGLEESKLGIENYLVYNIKGNHAYLTNFDVNTYTKMEDDLWMLCGVKKYMTVSLLALQEENKAWFNDLLQHVNS